MKDMKYYSINIEQPPRDTGIPQRIFDKLSADTYQSSFDGMHFAGNHKRRWEHHNIEQIIGIKSYRR